MMLLQTSSIRLRLLGCLTPSNNHIHHSTATSPAAQPPTEADPDAVSMQFMKSMIECTTSSENKAVFPSWDGSGADKTFFLEHIKLYECHKQFVAVAKWSTPQPHK
jgi:hypothetical protein